MLLAVVCAGIGAALLVPPRVRLPEAVARVPTRGRRRPATGLLAGCSAALVVLVLLPAPLSLLGAALAAVGAVHVVGRLEPAAVRRRRAALEAGLPQVVDLMAVCLAAGRSPVGALRDVSAVVDEPSSGELAGFTRRVELGADPLLVWRAMAAHPQLGPLGRTLQRTTETGASVGSALSRLGDELEAGRQASAQARARSVEVRASLPLGLCFLPAFVLIGIVPLVAGSVSLTFLAP